MGGPPVTGEIAKIDEEYMSLMAELGEGPVPQIDTVPAPTLSSLANSSMRKTSFNLFEQQMPPRQLLPPPTMAPTGLVPPNLSSMPPPPWTTAPAMAWPPGPPGKSFNTSVVAYVVIANGCFLIFSFKKMLQEQSYSNIKLNGQHQKSVIINTVGNEIINKSI